MKNVSLKDLKKDLSSLSIMAAKGEIVAVTKHNRPYIKLVPYFEPTVTRGKYFGKKSLTPALKSARRQSRSLEILLEDREDKL